MRCYPYPHLMGWPIDPSQARPTRCAAVIISLRFPQRYASSCFLLRRWLSTKQYWSKVTVTAGKMFVQGGWGGGTNTANNNSSMRTHLEFMLFFQKSSKEKLREQLQRKRILTFGQNKIRCTIRQLYKSLMMIIFSSENGVTQFFTSTDKDSSTVGGSGEKAR